MNAYDVSGVPVSNFMYGRQYRLVDMIVLHTIVGTLSSCTSRFCDPQAQVSAHYGVGYDGTVLRYVNEANTAYANGNWDVNLSAISIEHEDMGRYNDPRPDALYAASAELVADICRRWAIPVDRDHIKAHREVHATACPDALDVERIVRQAQGDDMPFATDPDAQAFKNEALNSILALKQALWGNNAVDAGQANTDTAIKAQLERLNYRLTQIETRLTQMEKR